MAKDTTRRIPEATDTALKAAEDLIYAAVGIVLIAGAAILLGDAVWRMASDLGDGVSKAIEDGLESLLLVFIFVELLTAVRTTITERKLVAEPFLIVGMIAAIKEIVVTSIKAKDLLDHDHAAFRLAVLEIGVLGGLLLVLGVTTYLVRRKEREPEE